MSSLEQRIFIKSLHKQPQTKLELLMLFLENQRDKTEDDEKLEQAILDELERRRQDAE